MSSKTTHLREAARYIADAQQTQGASVYAIPHMTRAIDALTKAIRMALLNDQRS